MAPDVTTEKIRGKNKSRFNSRQAVRSNSFVSEEAHTHPQYEISTADLETP